MKSLAKDGKLKAAVITFPGSNCDDDVRFALSEVCGHHVDMIFHKSRENLDAYHLIVIPGGFSFGDYLRCGAIAAQSPIMESVRRFADAGGYVLGTCNGFQILCEMGILPGALVRNRNQKFICRDVSTKVVAVDTPWTRNLKSGDRLILPIAHGDGRFEITEKEYETLKSNGQIVLVYVSSSGEITDDSNPNGSRHSIAGICNSAKNVFGLMPHPERCSDLRSRDGVKIFQSVTDALRERPA
jgi:phosphoribosylformylglycinamidine synthase subunit PurQ / glutaminase